MPVQQTTDSSEVAGEGEVIADGASVLTMEGASETVMETLREIWASFLSHVPLLIAGVLVLTATAILTMLVRRIMQKVLDGVELRRSLKELVERIVIMAVWMFGLLLSAMVVFPGLTPADALTALGVGSIAIGLAFKDIFENFFAGVLILWRFPFENGDFIECNGLMGRVEDVTVRNTMIRTTEGELVVVPNATIYKNPCEVLTSRERRRLTVMCGVAYDEDIATSRDVIRQAVESCDTVSRDDPVEIFAQEFADSSVNFEVTWWTGATPLEQRRSRDEVIQGVKRALDESGIEIPYPYRTLTFKESLTIRDSQEQGTGRPEVEARATG